jgi:hypothetical protein
LACLREHIVSPLGVRGDGPGEVRFRERLVELLGRYLFGDSAGLCVVLRLFEGGLGLCGGNLPWVLLSCSERGACCFQVGACGGLKPGGGLTEADIGKVGCGDPLRALLIGVSDGLRGELVEGEASTMHQHY